MSSSGDHPRIRMNGCELTIHFRRRNTVRELFCLINENTSSRLDYYEMMNIDLYGLDVACNRVFEEILALPEEMRTELGKVDRFKLFGKATVLANCNNDGGRGSDTSAIDVNRLQLNIHESASFYRRIPTKNGMALCKALKNVDMEHAYAGSVMGSVVMELPHIEIGSDKKLRIRGGWVITEIKIDEMREGGQPYLQKLCEQSLKQLADTPDLPESGIDYFHEPYPYEG